MKITNILKLEAVAFFIATVWAYYLVGASWWIFLVLILVPDIFIAGYLKDSKIGALVYNIGHMYIVPLSLLGVYLLFNILILLPISIIWLAHISMDRMLGFGLKLDTGFRDTHLGRIGRK
ncbi:MAG: DUF4260 domain-containing protein [Minisyncoccota bacterium]